MGRLRACGLGCLLCLCGYGLWGQVSYSTRSGRAIKWYKASQEALMRRNFDLALVNLRRALRKDKRFLEAYLQMAYVYETSFQPDKGIPYLEQALALDSAHHKNRATYLKLGQFYYQRGLYKASLPLLRRFLTFEKESRRHRVRVQGMVESCLFAEKAMRTPLSFSSERLPAPLNQFALQYFPSLTLDEKMMAFTVRKSSAPDADEDIFVSYRQNETWSVPRSISSQINTREHNEGSSVLSPDGQQLIFTACQRRDSYGSCDLYVSKKLGRSWSRPINMGKPINTPAWESQPSLSADGRTLYFVSNRAGGEGMRDLWVSYKTLSGWTVPKNLGSNINTPDEDLSPFIHANGRSLYFASKGHLGMGGYDLFLSEKEEEGTWGKPKNLGYPINQHQDQLSLFVSHDGTRGYYTEEHRTGNQYKSYLHSFVLPPQARVSQKTFLLHGLVRDSHTQAPLQARLSLSLLGQDSTHYEVFSQPSSGRYQIALPEKEHYVLYAQKEGYFFKEVRFDLTKFKQRIDIDLDSLMTHRPIPLENIFFDTDEYTLDKKSVTELQEVFFFLQQHATLRIEIAGHTDNTGSNPHNQTLSTQRAKSVHDFLKQKGIAAERIRYKGYGAQRPKASNDTQQGRQLNRRIEMEILF